MQRQYIVAASCAAAVLLLLYADIFTGRTYASSFLEFPPSKDRVGSSSSMSSMSSMSNVNCLATRQGRPVLANILDGVEHPFFLSMQDRALLSVNDMLDGKPFYAAEISRTMQRVLASIGNNSRRVVVDVGANIGWASFAATAMGFQVLAFEPVEENVLKLCDGIYLNRAFNLVKVFHKAVSDSIGTLTLHKVVGRYDNTAVSKVGATTHIKANVIPFDVATVTLDSAIPEEVMAGVALMKIDVQGWESHVLKGAWKLISQYSPYVIYEEDEPLLQNSNSSSQELLQLMREAGYTECAKIGDDRHCSKNSEVDFRWMH